MRTVSCVAALRAQRHEVLVDAVGDRLERQQARRDALDRRREPLHVRETAGCRRRRRERGDVEPERRERDPRRAGSDSASSPAWRANAILTSTSGVVGDPRRRELAHADLVGERDLQQRARIAAGVAVERQPPGGDDRCEALGLQQLEIGDERGHAAMVPSRVAGWPVRRVFFNNPPVLTERCVAEAGAFHVVSGPRSGTGWGIMTSMGRPPVEAPTMRLATLRRLVSATNQVLTYVQKAPVSEVAQALAGTQGAVAVIVDDEGVLVGTVRLGDLRPGHDPSSTVESVMFRNAPIMTPDTDVDDASR